MLSCLTRLGVGSLEGAAEAEEKPAAPQLAAAEADGMEARGPVLLGSHAAGKRGPALLPAAAMRRTRQSEEPSAADNKAPALQLPIPSLRSGGTLSTAASTPALSKPLLPGLKDRATAIDTPAPVALPSAMSWKMFLEHDEEAQQLQGVYEVEDAVRGEGCFGTVRLARLISAPSVVRAVKAVSKRTLKAESIVRREVNVLRSLDHPCICRLHETFEDDRAIYLVMEFIDGRELFDEIVDRGHLDEGSAAHVMHQVLGALNYCHERSVIHRDLKPENIMVQKRTTPRLSPRGRRDELQVKLIDFGLAVICASPSVKGRAGSSVTGSTDYMAPEARQGRVGAPADLWSCGVVMHVLLAGFIPEYEVLVGAERLDLSQSQYSALSEPARDLLLGLLQPDVNERMTAAAAAAHPWTRDSGIGGSARTCAPLIDALVSFHRSVKLRRAALTALAMQLTGQQLETLREQFMAIDADHNGRISKEELARSVAEMAPVQGADEVQSWVESVFDAVDTDGSHEIEYTEWLSAAQLECAQRSSEDSWAAFRVFDVDGDGRIDQEELARVLAQTPEEIADLLPQIDTNGDGVVDFEEFRRLLNVCKSQ